MNLAHDPEAANQFGITPRPSHKTKARWYHSHMVDWMIANPGGSMKDLAAFCNRSVPTVSLIVRSDMFQMSLRARQEQCSKEQRFVLQQKITAVAEASLDTILDVIKTKKTSLPLETLNEVADGALQRLGYGVETKAPSVQVNVQNNSPQVVVPVSLEELEASRTLMRQHQQQIAGSPPPESRRQPSRAEDAASLASPPSIGDFIDAEFSEVKGAALVNGSGEG